MDFAPEISNGSVTVGGDEIWWVFSRSSGFSDGDLSLQAIVGGVARYDQGDAVLTVFRLLSTDADGIWLSVSRKTVAEGDDDGGRTTLGELFIDQVDSETGDVVRSIPKGELTGFTI